jgi:uncharacterized LabA/DUF88 family protein
MQDRLPVQSGNPWIHLVSTLGKTGIIVAGVIYSADQIIEKGPSWIVNWSTVNEQIAKIKLEQYRLYQEVNFDRINTTRENIKEYNRLGSTNGVAPIHSNADILTIMTNTPTWFDYINVKGVYNYNGGVNLDGIQTDLLRRYLRNPDDDR